MARKSNSKTIQETLKVILEAENKAYEKAGITRTFAISFPNRQKTPLLGRLGAKLITMSGGIIQIQFQQRDIK